MTLYCGRRVKKLLIATLLLVGALIAARPAAAITLTSTNLSNVTLGAQVGNSVTTSILTADLTSQGGNAPMAIGTLLGSVYLNAGVYTYTLKVTPSVNSPKQFSTQFGLTGFDPALMKVGWSYTDATARGAVAAATAFNIGYTQHNGSPWILDFTVTTTNILSGFWTGAKLGSLTFFYQSTAAPALDPYNLSASKFGSAENWAPIISAPAPGDPGPPLATPEPGTLMLVGPGVAAGLYWLRRRTARSRDDD
jgi:hypothetical protein